MDTTTRQIEPIAFGSTPDGRRARLWRLANAHGMTAEVTDTGACLVSLRVPDGRGSFVDVVLGYDGAHAYGTNPPNFGAVVGRHANRIGGASFELDGTRHELAATERGNNLHSGPDMWFRRSWRLVRAEQSADSALIALALRSPDGDQGFPGTLEAHVTYELRANDALVITYEATPDARTIVNLTNHSYFNLAGHASGSALDHTLRVVAERYTAVDEGLVPTGELLDVTGTPLDLREPRRLRDGLEADFGPIDAAGGYDHNYELAPGMPGDDGLLCKPRLAATLACAASGISMDVITDTPGMQVYTANFIEGETGKGGITYHDHDAVCLETQFFPDAVHHPSFAQPVFGPERPYRSQTAFAFRHA